MPEEPKKYWIDKEQLTGVPGCDVHEAVAQVFKDYYHGDKKHTVELKVNDVTVTFSRKKF